MAPSSLAALLLLGSQTVNACTNMLVSAGATVDGSTHIAYNADDGGLYVRASEPLQSRCPGAPQPHHSWRGAAAAPLLPSFPLHVRYLLN